MRPRLLTILAVAYVLLIVYAALMPFDLRADRETAAQHLRRAWQFWPFGRRLHTSRLDLVSNFALYVPLGFLVAARGTARRGRARLPALLVAALAGMATSLVVESLQLWSVRRIAGAHDVLMNSAGAVAGGIAGAVLGRRVWVRLRRALRLRWVRRPVSLAGPILMALLAADALVPFLPTLDVSDVVRNVRASQLTLPEGLAKHPWQHWLVQRGAVYAALAGLLAFSSLRRPRPAWLRGLGLAIAFAIVAEGAKIFIVSRQANVANVLVAAIGAIAGTLVGAVAVGRISARNGMRLAAAALLGYVIYIEWEPFNFTWNVEAMAGKVPSGAQWLPLYHYAHRGKPEDIALFVRTLTLLAALAHLANLASSRLSRGGRGWRALKAALLGGTLGLVLEMGQFLLPRVPSVTDVFCFAAGAAIGAMIPRPGRLKEPGRLAAAHSGRP